MNRLYGFTYNEKKWSIKGNKDIGYTITNKLCFEYYFIAGRIIGIEQILEDTFLVYRHFTNYKFQIIRLKINTTAVIEYSHNFENFDFLTEDTIIFDKETKFDIIIYSISRNCEIHDINYLISGNHEMRDVYFFLNREIELKYEKPSDYPIYLSLSYTPSNALHYLENEYLQIIIDPISLKPIKPVYSSLSNISYVLSDSLTLKDVFEMENNYFKIFENFLNRLFSHKNNVKSTEELLNI